MNSSAAARLRAPAGGPGVGEVAAVQARLRRLVEATQAVAAEFALPLLYRRIAQSARTLVHADRVAFGVLGAAGAAHQIVQLEAEDLDAVLMPVGPGELAGLSSLAGQLSPGRISHFASSELELPLPGRWADGLLAVPVHHQEQMLGVLLLSPAAVDGSRTEDDDALLTLATTAGTAIASARTHDEARRRHDASRQASEITNQILATTDEGESLQIITDAVQQLTEAHLVTWWRPTVDDAGAVKVTASAGPGSNTPGGHPVVPLHTLGSAPVILASTSTPENPGPRSAITEILQTSGIESALLLPVGSDQEERGWLMCGRRASARPFLDLDLDITRVFILQMSVALDLAAAQAALVRARIAEDRERIARDLHDHVIQSLFSVGLRIKIFEQTLPSPAGGRKLGEAVQQIDDSIRQLRTTIFQLNNTATATDQPLRSAVLELVETITPGLGFRPRVTFEGPLDTAVSPLLTAEILAVLREAATNVTRYAKASQVTISLTTDGHTATLTVSDNGVGLGTATRRSGLDNLRVRAEILHGDFVLEVPESGGTSLRWSVPLDQESGSTVSRPTTG